MGKYSFTKEFAALTSFRYYRMRNKNLVIDYAIHRHPGGRQLLSLQALLIASGTSKTAA